MVGKGIRGMAYAENNRVLDTESDRYKMVASVLHERNGDSILEGSAQVWRIKELCPISVSRGDIQMTITQGFAWFGEIIMFGIIGFIILVAMRD